MIVTLVSTLIIVWSILLLSVKVSPTALKGLDRSVSKEFVAVSKQVCCNCCHSSSPPGGHYVILVCCVKHSHVMVIEIANASSRREDNSEGMIVVDFKHYR